ncbi:MAG: hypothetical protein ACXV3F_08795 [Frankiaceae bacterium]
MQFHGKGYNGFVEGEGAPGESMMTDTGWLDLGLDGSALTSAPGKGIFVQHMLHPHWHLVLVRNFPSTGFGADSCTTRSSPSAVPKATAGSKKCRIPAGPESGSGRAPPR